MSEKLNTNTKTGDESELLESPCSAKFDEEIYKLGMVLTATKVEDRRRIRSVARRLDAILYESCDHSCGTQQFEGDDVCRECGKFIS